VRRLLACALFLACAEEGVQTDTLSGSGPRRGTADAADATPSTDSESPAVDQRPSDAGAGSADLGTDRVPLADLLTPPADSRPDAFASGTEVGLDAKIDSSPEVGGSIDVRADLREAGPEAGPEAKPDLPKVCPASCYQQCGIGCNAQGSCMACATCSCDVVTGICHC